MTFHGRPRLVMMSLDEFNHLRGCRHAVVNAVELSEDVLSELRRIVGNHPDDDADIKLLGGLLDDDIGSQKAGFPE